MAAQICETCKKKGYRCYCPPNSTCGAYEPREITWFEKIKCIGSELGYTPDMKAYKADPSLFKGSVADISMFIRVAVTGKQNAPDLYTVMQIIGKERTIERINSMIRKI